MVEEKVWLIAFLSQKKGNGRMDIETIKREVNLNYDTYYIKNTDLFFGHILEHILIFRIKKIVKEIAEVTGQTTQELIKINISENVLLPEKIVEIVMSPVLSKEYERANQEIEQENLMKNEAYSSLLSAIRDNKEINEKMDLFEFQQWFDENVKYSTLYCFSYQNGRKSFKTERSDFQRQYENLSDIFIKNGIQKVGTGKFSYIYLVIPLNMISKSSQIYFLQKLMIYIQVSLQELRDEGIYYQVSFSLYHYENIELFIFISSSNHNRLILKMKEIEKNFDLDTDLNYPKSKAYPYQEELAVIYHNLDFLLDTSPKADFEDIKFINQIFHTINDERTDKDND